MRFVFFSCAFGSFMWMTWNTILKFWIISAVCMNDTAIIQIAWFIQMKARLYIPSDSCEWCDHFLQHFVIISFEWVEMIVWTQSNLIFEQCSLYFIFLSYCIIKRIANFIESTPINGRFGGDEEKTWRTTRRQCHGFDFWAIHLAI
jgi:hypothetical protein